MSFYESRARLIALAGGDYGEFSDTDKKLLYHSNAGELIRTASEQTPANIPLIGVIAGMRFTQSLVALTRPSNPTLELAARFYEREEAGILEALRKCIDSTSSPTSLGATPYHLLNRQQKLDLFEGVTLEKKIDDAVQSDNHSLLGAIAGMGFATALRAQQEAGGQGRLYGEFMETAAILGLDDLKTGVSKLTLLEGGLAELDNRAVL